MMKQYDYLIVGSGLYGATFARLATDAGYSCQVLERRSHVGGNTYTHEVEGIHVHQYGAHIFHTNNELVWNFVQRFARFNNYVNCPMANYKGQVFNLPFNMNTFSKMWDVTTPLQARAIIEQQRADCRAEHPQNLEEQALNLVGRDIYEMLIKGYTEKQWGRPCTELPPSIIRRLPVRFTYDNNYYDARYQGIPIGGYTAMVAKMLEGIDVRPGTDYLQARTAFNASAKKVIYTGPIDAYFNHCLGPLEYRHVKFMTEVLDTENHQGCAVVNYTDQETPYTRVIEHKHFDFGAQPKTVVSYEFSEEWKPGMEPYYPIENRDNLELYRKYAELATGEKNVVFGGRLGTYRYYDMDQVIEKAVLMFEAQQMFGVSTQTPEVC